MNTIDISLDSSVQKIKNNEEYAEIKRHRLFSGMDICFLDVHMQRVNICGDFGCGTLIITHCREGRMEFVNNRNENCFLSRGDFMVTCCRELHQLLEFPLGDYHGVVMLFKPEIIDTETQSVLRQFAIDTEKLQHRITEENKIHRGNRSTDHLFCELYSVKPQIQQGYFRLKMLQALLFLSASQQNEGEETSETSIHTETVREIHGYITEHCDIKITIEELSEKFMISATTLKTVFKKVYGKSVYAFIKHYRMHRAAQLLCETDKTIGEIASQMGYDNSSKFSQAFRQAFGVNPRQYRSGKR